MSITFAVFITASLLGEQYKRPIFKNCVLCDPTFGAVPAQDTSFKKTFELDKWVYNTEISSLYLTVLVETGLSRGAREADETLPPFPRSKLFGTALVPGSNCPDKLGLHSA